LARGITDFIEGGQSGSVTKMGLGVLGMASVLPGGSGLRALGAEARIASGTARAIGAEARFAATTAAKSLPEAERLVIGRGADLAKPGALGPGEFKLSWPPTATVKSEWKVNSGLLRQEMGNLRPIRDASIDDVGGMYLNAERYLLKDRGWTLDAGTSLWMPPTP
jgi:hypothetical protein